VSQPVAIPARQYSTLREWAYLQLRDMIITGALAPGEDLHESQLCAQLGISKSPLREALRQLAQDGLVVAESNKGSLVAPLTFEDFREIYSLRRQIEPLEVRLAVPNIDDATIARLRANTVLLDRCMRAGDNRGFAAQDVEFHLILARTSGHRRLLRIQESLQAEMMRLVILRVVQSGMRTETADEHRAIVDALEARDSEAAAARMTEHLERAEEWRRRALEERLHGLGGTERSELISV
jgi:DNA-binding GntR family transcriptional regulator